MCKRFRIIILNILIVLHVRITHSTELQFDVLKKQRIIEKQSQGIMSPKMDYDEWTPLGRGDPLKNDPTFDYSPPMVSKVKYWINPALRTPDPPIVPSKDYTTESGVYTVTSNLSTKPSSISTQESYDTKRFYMDIKDPGTGMSYVQLLNAKYNTNNNNINKPQQLQYQNLFHSPTRHPFPPPLPMLVPPPPVEPSSYSSNRIENSTILEFSWDTKNYGSTMTTAVPMLAVTVEPKNTFIRAPSVLHTLLIKERSTTHRVTMDPATVAPPFTPKPVPFTLKQNTVAPKPPTPSTYLIIQGHSKVKKYGGNGKLDTSDVLIHQDTNDINDTPKYQLPRDARAGRHINLEDFLPLTGTIKATLKSIMTNQTEGSDFGAELTKATFPTYIRPSTTLVYESPRFYVYGKDKMIQEGEDDS